MTAEDGNEHWTLPAENTIKVNTDAAIFAETNRYSFSFVARNHKGELIEALSKGFTGNVGPAEAEAIGVREALSWIKLQDWSNVIVETDCLTVVQATRSSSAMLSYFGGIINSCRELLQELSSRKVVLRFIKRSANMAHHLARYNCNIADCIWRMGNAHPEFINILMNDLINE